VTREQFSGRISEHGPPNLCARAQSRAWPNCGSSRVPQQIRHAKLGFGKAMFRMALPCDVYPLVHSAFNPVGAKGIVAELCVNEDRLAHAEEHVAARGFDMRYSGRARCSISPKLKIA
jgi:hypothetical protein